MAKTNSVTIQVADVLEEVDRECAVVLETTSKEVADEAVQKLRNTSPKKSGKYARGWRVSVKSGRGGAKTYVVHNSTNYQLTHLLENGHIVRNKKGTYGRTRAFKHIAPVEEWAGNELVKRITEDLK